MIGKLYQPKKGTHFVVRVLDKRREFFAGEPSEETGKIYQIGLQRQRKWLESGYGCHWKDDLNFEPYTMELDIFLNEYEELK